MRISSFVADRDPAEAAWSALRESDERYRELAEHCRDVCWIADLPAGRLAYLNPAFESVFGLEPDLAYDDPDGWRYVVHEADRSKVNALWTQLDPDCDGWDVEYRIRRPNGTVAWIHERAYAIQNLSGEALRIAGISEDVTERRQAQEQLQQYQDRLQRLASELDVTCERERRRIAEGLHDDIGQNLALARIQIGKLAEVIPAEHRELLESTARLLQRTLESSREFAFELTPPPLYELGLWPALDWLAEQLKRDSGLRVQLEDRAPDTEIGRERELVSYRVIRELLHNVVKHSQSDRAVVRRFVADGSVFLQVEDFGRGFDTQPDAAHSGCLGLFLTRERVRTLAGSMNVESRPGQGTTVTITMPLQVT